MKMENKTIKKIILILTFLVMLFLSPFILKKRKNNIDIFINNLFNRNQIGAINA